MFSKFIITLLLFTTTINYSQDKYPKNYFQKPLKIPLVLAGTFGELRSNHFHAGIDIKTQKREGLPIYAIADGYVSRIKIQHWGYGKALYLRHPNGYTSVYAHLQKFAPKIEAFVKKKQYAKESYIIQLFPNESLLKVKKGEIIAYSGNTGGSTAPHLHFEIRDTKTEKIINPLLFGIKVKDSIKPEIKTAYAYPLGDFSQINQSENPIKLQIHKQKDGNLIADKIFASGTIGIGVKSYDRLNGANNKNGIYKLDLYVNDEKIYNHCLETFSFAEGKYVNLLVDYEHYKKKYERIQRCFVIPNNKLSIYGDLVNSGQIYIQDGMNYIVEVIASDLKGNETKLTIPIQGKNQKIIFKNETNKTDYYFKRTEFNTISKENVKVAFPKYSFYDNLYFDFDYTDGVVKLHDNSVPLHKRFTLTFNISDYTKNEQTHLFIAQVKSKGRLNYVSTKRKENKLYCNSKTLGKYKLASDYTKPTIKPINFKNGQWLSAKKTLKVRIKDNLTGIESYRATIDGKWILMEYEPKTGILTYDFNDKKFKTAKHTLKIVVSDKVKNTNTYIATFYKKD